MAVKYGMNHNYAMVSRHRMKREANKALSGIKKSGKAGYIIQEGLYYEVYASRDLTKAEINKFLGRK